MGDAVGTVLGDRARLRARTPAVPSPAAAGLGESAAFSGEKLLQSQKIGWLLAETVDTLCLSEGDFPLRGALVTTVCVASILTHYIDHF